MRRLARDILAAEGPLARALGEGYEPRSQQLEMADAVEIALATRGTLLAEAGTGVGKSFAYLVPAIMRAMAHQERVVIATNTIALQEQLVQKDIPFLRGTLGETDAAEDDPDGAGDTPIANAWGLPAATLRPLIPALVKGRGNYVSIRRLRQASERQGKIFADEAQRRSLHAIEDWAYATGDGTLSTLPPLERPGVWDRVQSDADNCMGRKCATYETCFFQRSRRLMESANLLVCNHAVFFADLNMRVSGVARRAAGGAGTGADAAASESSGGGAAGFGFLPEYHHVILDEAHALEDVACDHFGLSLTESRVEHLLGALYHTRTGRGFLPYLASASKRAEAIDAAHHLVLKALDASRAFFDDLVRAASGRGVRSGRIRTAHLVPNPLSPAMDALALRLQALKEDCKVEADQFELNAYATRAAAIAFDAASLIGQAREGYVYWLEAGEESEGASRAPGAGGALRVFTGRTRVKLACSPIEVGPLLRQHLFNGQKSVVLASATMTVGAKPAGHASAKVASSSTPTGPVPAEFGHLATRLGIDAATTLAVGSPFDHARQAEVFVDLSVPDPRASAGRGDLAGPDDSLRASATSYAARQEAYHDALAERIEHHVLATGGGAFVLFTSFAAITAVAQRLQDRLAPLGLPLLAQGRDGTPGQILERFRADDAAVLLGAASFWQGVDVKGRGLRNVIITKLPFDPPDRPLVEARGELIRQRGGDPFRDDALPRAILKFKQGFGRLIRSQTDFGRVVILDPRVETTAYGRRFLAVLPAGVRVHRTGLPGERAGPVGPGW